MNFMTSISAAAENARENARTSTGQFGAQEHTAPEFQLDERVALPVIVTARLTKPEPIAYPEGLPNGGKVEADLEDSGGIFVSITFDDQYDEHGDPIRISLGGDDEYGSGNDWNSIRNGEPGFTDDNLNDIALGYLRELHTAIDGDAESVRWAATTPHLQEFVKRATLPPEPEDYSDEAEKAKMLDRGEKLVGMFADAGDELDDNAADAIADILGFAKENGADVAEILRRAELYSEDD